MTAAKTPPDRVTLHWYGMAGVLQDSNREVDNPVEYILASVVEKRERALRSELGALRMLYKAISRARDYNSKPGINFTPSIRRALEDVDGVRAALAAADEGEAKR